jgi:serine protease Do
VKRLLPIPLVLVFVVAACSINRALADDSFAKVAEEVNLKLVKLFGTGGFKGLASYGTGVIVSKDGYVLTVNSHILDTRDLRVHMPDGTRYTAKVVAREPVLDVALVQIEAGKRALEIEHYFDVVAAAKRPVLEPGTHVLAFSNQFQIATREEPMSIQRGVVAAYAKLAGRIGIFEAAYRGNVYVVDAITNNPGAGGGVLTTRKGELVAMIGKELRNELTNTWVNYALPFNASVEATDKEGRKIQVTILDLVTKKDKYKPAPEAPKVANLVYHGMVLVPNVVERTPPYIEEVIVGSPADRAKLKADDLIVYVDGLPVQDINAFNTILANYSPRSEIKLEIQRGDKLLTVPLTLERPAEKKKK